MSLACRFGLPAVEFSLFRAARPVSVVRLLDREVEDVGGEPRVRRPIGTPQAWVASTPKARMRLRCSSATWFGLASSYSSAFLKKRRPPQSQLGPLHDSLKSVLSTGNIIPATGRSLRRRRRWACSPAPRPEGGGAIVSELREASLDVRPQCFGRGAVPSFSGRR